MTRSQKILRMLQWTSKQFHGNRSLFKYPYQESIKQQLRVINCYRIAIGEETIPIIPEHSENGDATLFKISDKRDDWERRNMLGFALISMSATKPVLNKINAHTTNCREAYLILENTYGGNLTVAEMAFLDNMLEKKKETTESAETFSSIDMATPLLNFIFHIFVI